MPPSPIGTIKRVDQATRKLATIDVDVAAGPMLNLALKGWGAAVGGPSDRQFNWHSVASYWPERHVLCAQWEGAVLALIQIDDDYLPLRTRPREERAIYVSFLEVDPQIRTGAQNRRFVGVGAAMLTFAISRSRQLGMRGRIGLHSIAQATQFYATLGFREVVQPGPNEYWEPYLELDPESAGRFLASTSE